VAIEFERGEERGRGREREEKSPFIIHQKALKIVHFTNGDFTRVIKRHTPISHTKEKRMGTALGIDVR
jgi:hypothetical protein